MIKGIPGLYENILHKLDKDSELYEWIFDNPDSLRSGQICETIVGYEKRYKWYLQSRDYIRESEPESTWLALKYPEDGSFPELEEEVIKYFNLESDEHLTITHAKKRLVILVEQHTDNWWDPMIEGYYKEAWWVIPIYSYKERRHDQIFVLNDQKLGNKCRFYLPKKLTNKPGLDKESTAFLYNIQLVRSSYLRKITCLCNSKATKMKRPFKIGELAYRILLGHLFYNMGCFESSLQKINQIQKDKLDDYEIFKICVEEVVNLEIENL